MPGMPGMPGMPCRDCLCESGPLATHCSNAAKFGHIDCLRCAHERTGLLDENTLFAAGNNIDCLRYVHEHGVALCSYSKWYAMCCGNLECLRYTHEHGVKWVTQWSIFGFYEYFTTNQIQCVRYAILSGAHLPKKLMYIMLRAKMRAAAMAVKLARKARLTSRTLLAIQATPNIEDNNRHVLQRLIVQAL